MPVRGGDNVRRRMRDTIRRIRGPMTEKTVTRILIIAAGYASSMTPIATSALINSQYRRVQETGKGYRGELGYGQDYAVYVHEAPGALLGANVPRWPARLGVYWGPNGEPGFLEKAFERDGRSDIEAEIDAGYRL